MTRRQQKIYQTAEQTDEPVEESTDQNSDWSDQINDLNAKNDVLDEQKKENNSSQNIENIDIANPFSKFLSIAPINKIHQRIESNTIIDQSHASPFSAKKWPHLKRTDLFENIDTWQSSLSEDDLCAYEALLRLKTCFHEPETVDRVNVRELLRSGFPGLRPEILDHSLERVIGHDNVRGIAYLSRGIQAANAVGRVWAQDNIGQPTIGTGFLVAPNLLLTNNHVLYEGAQYQSRVDFNFELESDGTSKTVRSYATDPNIFLTDEELDFSLIGVCPMSRNGGAPLTQFGWLRLLPESGKALKREPVSIIQHPNGLHKAIALRDSYIIGCLGDYIYYTTDTEAGSSGSPVLSEDWFVVALHHRTVPNPNQPCTWVANRGIRVSSIVRRLQEVAESDEPRNVVARDMLAQILPPEKSSINNKRMAKIAFDARKAPIQETLDHLPKNAGGYADFSDERVHGSDNRWRLPQSDHRHGAILRTISGHRLGTGVVVGNRLALTVSHALMPRQIKLFIFDDFANPIDMVRSIGAQDYREKHSNVSGRAHELTGLQIQSHQPFPNHLIPTLISSSDLQGRLVEVIGYPTVLKGQPVGRICVAHQGTVGAVQDGLIFYTNLDVSAGQSGGAVVLAGTSQLVGIHLSGPVRPIPPGLFNANIGIHLGPTQMQEVALWNH